MLDLWQAPHVAWGPVNNSLVKISCHADTSEPRQITRAGELFTGPTLSAEEPEDLHLTSEQDVDWRHFKTPKSQNVNATWEDFGDTPEQTGDAVVPRWTNRVIPSDKLKLHQPEV